MKPVRNSRILILSALMILLQLSGFSQDTMKSKEFNPLDSLHCKKLISTYREFFKWDLYDQALESWQIIFNEYPDYSEKLYVDGVTMYRYFIGETPEGLAREDKIDTLMLIYDQRMAYFGGEGNILGRKGSDLLRYRSSDQAQVQAAYEMLKKSVELQGSKSRESVMLNFISAGLLLNHAALIDDNQAMEDYFLISGFLEQLEGRSSRWKKTRISIDKMIQKEGILSCEGLDRYFGPQFEQNSSDRNLLERVINSYASAGCSHSDLYASASEKLYEIEPGPESAHHLAVLFIGKNDLDKASQYLKMAVLGEDLSNETRAEWFYELSIVSIAKEDHCEAINYARESIANNNDYGKAYMAMGDAFIACRKYLGDNFEQQSVYWAASDMYQIAVKMDPALTEEAGQKLADCARQYPVKEDVFFQDLQEGNNYLVGGCIQETTTVRSRN